MANRSYKRAERRDKTALCQIGLKFHKQFFSVLHKQGVWEKTQTATLHIQSTVGALHPAMAVTSDSIRTFVFVLVKTTLIQT